MKIKDIIAEDYDGTKKPVNNDPTPHGGMHKDHIAVQQGVDKMRDVGGYDRVYHINRMMMAMAMHDGKSKKPVDMPDSSWVEKYNTAHPYTDAEHNMVAGAMKTVPTDHHVVQKRSKSKEPDEVHKVSPVAARKKNKHGV
jgi:hypothetical protein